MREDIKDFKIIIYGNSKEITEAKQILQPILKKLTKDEAKDRLILQEEVVRNIKASLSYDGNLIWNDHHITRDFQYIMKNGVKSLSDYLYSFFHLCCGTIAHYSKQGWITTYPSRYDIIKLFERNEFGSSVLSHQPVWATDRIKIIKEIMQIVEKEKDTIVKENDNDVQHKLDVLEASVKQARKDPKFAEDLIKKVFN